MKIQVSLAGAYDPETDPANEITPVPRQRPTVPIEDAETTSIAFPAEIETESDSCAKSGIVRRPKI